MCNRIQTPLVLVGNDAARVSSTTQIKHRIKKSVRFNSKCHARIYNARGSKRALWYSENEYQRFRQECDNTVACLAESDDESTADTLDSTDQPSRRALDEHMKKKSNNLPAQEAITSRGIEFRLSERTYLAKYTRRQQAAHAIFEEQWRQYEEGKFSENALREAYQQFSTASYMEAFQRALEYQFEEFGHYRHSLSHESSRPSQRIIKCSKAA